MASDEFQKGLGLGPQEVGDVSDETATVIELSGIIKWFDVSKGYGFIVPDGGLADVLLHVTCLRRDGFQVVELPITFVDREVGQSKMSRAVVLEAIWRVPLLRIRH